MLHTKTTPTNYTRAFQETRNLGLGFGFSSEKNEVPKALNSPIISY